MRRGLRCHERVEACHDDFAYARFGNILARSNVLDCRSRMRTNPEWHSDEKRHALNQFMTRVLFCLFSEDTGSFKKDIFVKAISEFGGEDGQHLLSLFQQIFDIMNMKNDVRYKVPAHIAAFPYVNGGLFADKTEVPAFSKHAKRLLSLTFIPENTFANAKILLFLHRYTDVM